MTFVLTDIEGSTTLTEQLGDVRWMDLLRDPNATVEREVNARTADGAVIGVVECVDASRVVTGASERIVPGIEGSEHAPVDVTRRVVPGARRGNGPVHQTYTGRSGTRSGMMMLCRCPAARPLTLSMTSSQQTCGSRPTARARLWINSSRPV